MQHRLGVVGSPSNPAQVVLPTVFRTTGANALFRALGGARFADGAYRVHDPARALGWTDLAVAAFPQLQGQVLCFASDWVGRQFALSTEPASNGQPGVILIDVQSDEVLHTDRDLDAFHEDLLAIDPEPALALKRYSEWLAAGGAVPTLSQCVEYTVPVYLGGASDLANMAITDMDVMWDIGGQVLRQVRALPEGTPVDIDFA